MKQLLILLAVGALFATAAQALTLQSGQVIGSDGNVYNGASPEQQDALISRAQSGGDIAGLNGNSVFVVVGDTITFVPVDEIRGKSDDSMKQIIGDEVIQNVTGIEGLSLTDFENATSIAEQTGIPLEDIVSGEGLEGLDAEMIANIAAAAQESGIDFENLIAVNAIISELPQDEFATLTQDLSALVEEGFAEEINNTLTELSEIEGGLDNLLKFDSLEECLAGGGANCEETARVIEGNEG